MAALLLLLLISFVSIYIIDPIGYCLQQENAVVNYFDPHYVVDVQTFTFRRRRGEPYRSNLTVNLLHSWGNNMTFMLEYKLKHGGSDVIVRNRVCVLMKLTWITDFLATYMKVPKCPVPTGKYGLWNIELPPRNFPLPLPKGECTVIGTILLEDKKKILQVSVKVK